jgi:hypothetical protein
MSSPLIRTAYAAIALAGCAHDAGASREDVPWKQCYQGTIRALVARPGGGAAIGGADLVGDESGAALVALDARGAVAWQHTFAATNDIVDAVAIASDGTTFAVGEIASGGSVDFGGRKVDAAAHSAFIVAYDPTGRAAWAKTFAGGSLDAIAVGRGGLVVAGDFGDGVDLGGGALPASGPRATGANDVDDDPVLLALGLDGSYRWAHRLLKAPGSLRIGQIAIGRTGDIVLAATSFGPVDLGDGRHVPSPIHGQLVLAAYHADGTRAWSHVYGNDGPGPAVVAVAGGGDIYFAGGFQGKLDLGGQRLSTLEQGGFVARYAPDGTLRGAERAGAPDLHPTDGETFISGLAVDDADQPAVIGRFSGHLEVGGTVLHTRRRAREHYAVFAAGLARDGDARWAVNLGPRLVDDKAPLIAVDHAGHVIVSTDLVRTPCVAQDPEGTR